MGRQWFGILCRPSGAEKTLGVLLDPTAYAVGYSLTALRAFNVGAV